MQQPPYPPPYGAPQPPYPPPYQPPYQPPPKGGPSGTAVALIVIAVVAVVGLFVVLPLGIGVWVGFKNASKKAAAPVVDPRAVPLTESYTTPNHLLTAHYPADFAAKTLDDATLVLSRNFDDGTDEALTLAAVSNPITNDAHELARILLAQVDKNVVAKGGTSTKTGERKKKCLGKYDGVETEGTFQVATSALYETKACFFIHGSRGYELRYDIPRARSATEATLMDRIIQATDLAP